LIRARWTIELVKRQHLECFRARAAPDAWFLRSSCGSKGLLFCALRGFDFSVDLPLGLEPVVHRFAVLPSATFIDLVSAAGDSIQSGFARLLAA
jgi:hypothetical protein